MYLIQCTTYVAEIATYDPITVLLPLSKALIRNRATFTTHQLQSIKICRSQEAKYGRKPKSRLFLHEWSSVLIDENST